MTASCDQIGAFFDGQLSALEAEAFRDHLSGCTECQRESREYMLLAIFEEEHVRGKRPDAQQAHPRETKIGLQPPVPVHRDGGATAPVIALETRRRRSWPKMIVGGSVASLAAAAAVLLFISSAPTTLMLAKERSMELRLAYRPADAYRPYGATRAVGAQSSESIPFEEMARLERRGDQRGLGALSLLKGDAPSAERHLAAAPRSTDVEVDLAVAAFLLGRKEEALRRLDAVLAAAPEKAQALWNRALILRDLGLPLAAAADFDQVASLGEPGWSDEARKRAALLRGLEDEKDKAWKFARKSALAWSTEGAPLPDDVIRRWPSLVRHYFYHARRRLRTPEALDALEPIAAALDRDSGGHVLADSIRAARKRPALPADLGALYADLVAERKKPDPATLRDLADRARRLGDDDLLLGALMLGERQADADEIARLAARARDPWLDALADWLLGRRDHRAGGALAAEARLDKALAACRQPLDRICVLVADELTRVRRTLIRPAAARAAAIDGLARAERAARYKVSDFFFQLGDITHLSDDLPTMRSYFAEAMLRDRSCPAQRFGHEMTALALMRELDAPGARAELDRAPRCQEPPTWQRADLLAFVARAGLAQAGDELLRAELLADEARQTAGDRMFTEVLIARLDLARDPAGAEARLRQVADEAGPPARPDDSGADVARPYARLTLAMEASRNGRWGDALAWLARRPDAEPPRCALAVAIDDERALAVASGPDGRMIGHFDGHRARESARDPEALMPARVRSALTGCAEVAVFAAPPLHGLPRLLPAEIPWSYRRSAETPSRPAAEARRRLIVTDVAAPERLGLKRLSPRLVKDPSVTTLSGTDATPSRVLTELQAATEVEIHAHGYVDLGRADASLLALAPEANGEFELTAARIRDRRLAGRPVVVLAACHAAEVAPFLHRAWGLPLALIESGARAVFASPAAIPDADAAAFFDGVLGRVRGGTSPVIALADERRAWLAKGTGWVADVLVFD